MQHGCSEVIAKLCLAYTGKAASLSAACDRYSKGAACAAVKILRVNSELEIWGTAIAKLRLAYTGRDSFPEASSNQTAIVRLRLTYTGRDSLPIYFL